MQKYACRLRRPTLVIGACLALFAGLLLARVGQLDNAYWLWPVGLLGLLTLWRHNVFTLALLSILFLGIGWWRGTAYVRKIEIHQQFHMQKVTVVGRATDEAVYDERQQLEFTLSGITVLSPEHTPLVGNMTIRGFGEPVIYRGDVVQVTGKVYPTQGNNLASISFADLQVIHRDTSRLNGLRREFSAGMQSALPEPLASFALGLLIGQRTTLPEATEEQLREVGLTHIIAVSGYNLTVIILACRRWLADRSKFQATAACVGLVIVFLLLTGSSPPIVRASLISMLGLAAWYYGREIKPLVLVLVGAAVTALANPLYIWGNVSWYLSFLAFFGVLVVAPLLVKRYMHGKQPKLLLSVLIESTCAGIFVLPYVLYIFGQASLVSLLANVLVVPCIPVAMVLGLAAGLSGMLLTPVAGWFAWPAQWLLTYMLDMAALLSRVPYAFVEHIGFSLPMMLVAYGVFGGMVWMLWRKTRHQTDRQAM